MTDRKKRFNDCFLDKKGRRATLTLMFDLRRVLFAAVLFFFAGSLVFSVLSLRKTKSARIFVKDKGSGHLVLQKVVIPKTSSENERVFWILRELISGPTGDRYERILDPNIEIRRVIIRKGIAYVTFDWKFIDSLYMNPALVVRAITSSIILNLRRIEGVKILVEDIEPVSTLGDVSLGSTFRKTKNRWNKTLK
jgi:hypothetical protein